MEVIREKTFEEIYPRHKNILEKNGVSDTVALHRLAPRSYITFDECKDRLDKDDINTFTCVRGTLKKVRDKSESRYHLMAYVDVDGKLLIVNWWGDAVKFLYRNLLAMKGMTVYVCGKVSMYQDLYDMSSVIFFQKSMPERKVVPVWDIKGISDQKMYEYMRDIDWPETPEYLPNTVRRMRFKGNIPLPSPKEMEKMRNMPMTSKDIETVKRRAVLEDLLYFASHMEMEDRNLPKGSPVIMSDDTMQRRFIESLGFELTAAQAAVVKEMTALVQDGRCMRAIVQGDVGSGKTAVATAMLMLAAGNGHQAVLCAPTETLAVQHYNKISAMADNLGVKCALLLGGPRKGKADSLRRIRDGEISIIIGTHAVFSAQVEYHDLVLFVIDEEHVFGVEQKEALRAKAVAGAHEILMSATLVPRSKARTVMSDNQRLFNIEARPTGRLPIITSIETRPEEIIAKLKLAVLNNEQSYVVCPHIDKSDDNTASVEETLSWLREFFDEDQVVAVTGKMKPKEIAGIMQSFQKREFPILVATSLVSVGVDNKNATYMIIRSPEMFGMSTLHQIRGRVGRGDKQSYCVLEPRSSEPDDRLTFMVDCNDGAEIAEEDFRRRGAGHLYGVQQTGRNKYIAMALEYPDLFGKCKDITKGLKTDEIMTFVKGYRRYHEITEEGMSV